jgi:hypothetical protein
MKVYTSNAGAVESSGKRFPVGAFPVIPSAAISLSAEIVAVGFDPTAVGTIAPSTT